MFYACSKEEQSEILSSLHVKEVSIKKNELVPFDSTTIKVVYSEAIDLVDKSKIVFDGNGFEVRDSVSKLIFTFKNLTPNTRYNLKINKGAVETPIAKITSNDYSLEFTTKKDYLSVIDQFFNTLSLSNPKLMIQLSESVTLIDESKINIESNKQLPIAEMKDSADCIVVHFKSLEPGASYSVNIKEGAVRSSAKDDVFLKDYTYKFVTTIDKIDDGQQIMPDYSEDLPNPKVPAKGQLVFNIDPEPVNPNAIPEAKEVYSYLRNNFGTKILTACMEDMGGSINTRVSDWYSDNVGEYPAMRCYDFMNATRNWSWYTSFNKFVEYATDWWNKGGIVLCMWHWRDPSLKSDSFRPEYHDGGAEFDVRKIYDTSSEEYQQMIRDIDIVAGWLKKLQDNGVPVLWRPLHEAEGTYKNTGWFWWGAGKGPERERSAACMELWRVMYNRMVYYHGLNNLLWVWTSHVEGHGYYDYPWYSDGKRWYPGNDMVDVIGLDIYEKKADHVEQYLSFAKTAIISDTRKIVAMTECGYAPTPEVMDSEGCLWSYFMPWTGSFTESEDYNGVEHLKDIYNSDKALTLKDSSLNK